MRNLYRNWSSEYVFMIRIRRYMVVSGLALEKNFSDEGRCYYRMERNIIN